MTSSDIIDVNDANFDYHVLAYSERKPVVVDFWAEWCKPCQPITSLLELLTDENDGAFRLAKVNVEDNPQLTRRYHIHKLPDVKAFQYGRIAHEFHGPKTNQEVREFIHQVVPGHENLLMEKAKSYLREGDWREAEDALKEFLDSRPLHPQGNLVLAKSLLAQGKSREAYRILKNFPASHEFQHAEQLLPLARAMETFDQDSSTGNDRLDAIYRHAMRLIELGNIPAALDGLMDILRKDKTYRDGEARVVVLGLFELLGADHPLTKTYRNELANILF
jgi:putative thioredoxin